LWNRLENIFPSIFFIFLLNETCDVPLSVYCFFGYLQELSTGHCSTGYGVVCNAARKITSRVV
jgi:hypothetical protein